jgi:MFS family permease
MALFMMVFMGGTPIGAPVVGWITDAYGPQVGFALGGIVSLAAAVTIGLVLAHAGGLRQTIGWHHGHPRLRFVPRETREELAAAA